MKRILLSAAALLFLTGITTAAVKEIGTIGSIDAGRKEIVVNVNSGADLKMGDILEIQSDAGKIILEVTFPMMTTSKCKIKGKGKHSGLSKGMMVYRYGKNDKPADKAGAAGETKKFGNIEMVKIPGGTFTMGSPESEKDRRDDERQHEVKISPFWMGTCEVTQKDYAEITGINPSNLKGDYLPVEQVTWYDAVEYCNKLSGKQGLIPYYKIDKNTKDPDNTNEKDTLKYTVTILGGNGFRLPTESEWEYACRGATKTVFYYGNKLDSTMANFNGNYPYNADKGVDRGMTASAGSYKTNTFGLYDMHGNVWEWCWDWYGNYGSVTIDPKGTDNGTRRVTRGGSWLLSGTYLRSALRQGYMASDLSNDLGFRVARSVF